jgi:hypothetical protein
MTDPLLPELPDEAYWDKPLESMQRVMMARMGAGLLGPVVGAPARVPLQGRDGLPVWGCYVEPLGTHGRSFQVMAVVVASGLDSGKVYAAPAFPPPASAEPLPPPSPVPPPPGTSGLVWDLDLYEALEALPRRPAAYALCVLVRGRRSNVVRIELYGASGVSDDPEVRRFLEEHRRRKGPPDPWPPGAAVVDEARAAELPPVPAGTGIALSVPRVHVLEARARCLLSGSFRVPVLPRHVVPAAPGAGTERIHAVVPVTLVLTSEDYAGPYVAELRIACHEPLQPAEPHPVAVGRFAVDLMSLPGMPREPRTRHVYAFAGAAASEAATVSFVPEELLQD